MRFIINPCIFDNQNNKHDLVVFLLRLCDKRNHFVKILDIANNSYLEFLDSLKLFSDISYLSVCSKIDNDDKDFLIYTSEIFEVKDRPNENEISIKQAFSLIEEPFKVFLENGRNDKNFLLFFSSLSQKNHLQELIKTKEVIFEHGGGIGELRVMVQNTSLKNNRSYFLFDSDALPLHEHIINKDAKFIGEKCAEKNIKFTMLKRRFIESYIPNICLSTYVESKKGTEKSKLRRLFVSYSMISCDSTKNFYNLKNGLLGDFNQFKKKMGYEDFKKEYYRNIPDKETYIYTKGFGSDISKVYEEQIYVPEDKKRKDTSAWNEVNGVVNEILRIV